MIQMDVGFPFSGARQFRYANNALPPIEFSAMFSIEYFFLALGFRGS